MCMFLIIVDSVDRNAQFSVVAMWNSVATQIEIVFIFVVIV